MALLCYNSAMARITKTPRSFLMRTRMRPEEHLLIQDAANRVDMAVAEWVRRVLLREAKRVETTPIEL